jgi:hypothetical protein
MTWSAGRLIEWLRRRSQTTVRVPEDARRIVRKSSNRGEPPPETDQLQELVRIVGESDATDMQPHRDAGADDGADEPSGNPRVQQQSLHQLRPRRPFSLLRSRTASPHGDLSRRYRQLFRASQGNLLTLSWRRALGGSAACRFLEGEVNLPDSGLDRLCYKNVGHSLVLAG